MKAQVGGVKLQNSKQIESEEKSIELKVGKQQLKLKVQNIHFLQTIELLLFTSTSFKGRLFN